MASKDNTIQASDSTPCAFAPAPLSLQWGDSVVLTATVPGAAGFGSSPGTVRLHGIDGTTPQTVSHSDWTDASISLTLPSERPNNLPEAPQYGISVTRAGASSQCFFFAPLVVLPACSFVATPTTVEWGQPVTLTAALASLGAGFGEAEGTVALAAGGTDVIISASSVDWHNDTMSVTLPPTRPSEFPDTTLYQITVTRVDGASSCGSAALTVLPVIPCAVVPFLIPVNWGQTITIETVLDGIADFGDGGTLRLGKGGQSVDLAVVEWLPKRITANLPGERPDHLPESLEYQLFVTRTGGSAPCASVPLVLLPICSEVGNLLKEAWVVSDGDGDPLVLGAPVPAYELGPADRSPLFKVQQQVVPGNPLVESFSTPGTGIAIRMGFFAGGDAQSHDFSVKEGPLHFGGEVPVLNDPNALPQIEVLPHPDIIPAFGEGVDDKKKTWTISLKAEVSVPGCDLTLLDLTFTLKQMPLVIPQIAAWFVDEDFGGDALVMVAADDAMLPVGSLPDPFVGIYDAKTDHDTRGKALRLAQLAKLTGTFGDITDDLGILSGAFGHLPEDLRRLPGVGEIEALTDLVSRLADGRMVAVTRNSSVTFEEVYRTYGEWFFERSTFHRTASSLVLAGVKGYTGVDVLTGIPPAPPWECCFDWSGYSLGDGLVSSWSTLGNWNDRVEESGWCRICPPF
ncbi:MAG: hypothetical protein M3144_03885 [Actinomycetota bacterium]|nr:hypothetical protein [Actinomycetota bacterium]